MTLKSCLLESESNINNFHSNHNVATVALSIHNACMFQRTKHSSETKLKPGDMSGYWHLIGYRGLQKPNRTGKVRSHQSPFPPCSSVSLATNQISDQEMRFLLWPTCCHLRICVSSSTKHFAKHFTHIDIFDNSTGTFSFHFTDEKSKRVSR